MPNLNPIYHIIMAKTGCSMEEAQTALDAILADNTMMFASLASSHVDEKRESLLGLLMSLDANDLGVNGSVSMNLSGITLTSSTRKRDAWLDSNGNNAANW